MREEHVKTEKKAQDDEVDRGIPLDQGRGKTIRGVK